MISWWELVTDHLVIVKKGTRPSLNNPREFPDYRPWFLWGTLNSLTSAGRATLGQKQSRRLLEDVAGVMMYRYLIGQLG